MKGFGGGDRANDYLRGISDFHRMMQISCNDIDSRLVKVGRVVPKLAMNLQM